MKFIILLADLLLHGNVTGTGNIGFSGSAGGAFDLRADGAEVAVDKLSVAIDAGQRLPDIVSLAEEALICDQLQQQLVLVLVNGAEVVVAEQHGHLVGRHGRPKFHQSVVSQLASAAFQKVFNNQRFGGQIGVNVALVVDHFLHQLVIASLSYIER